MVILPVVLGYAAVSPEQWINLNLIVVNPILMYDKSILTFHHEMNMLN